MCSVSKVTLVTTVEDITSTPVSPSQRGPWWRLPITKRTISKPVYIHDCGVSCLLSAPKLLPTNATVFSAFHLTTHVCSGRSRFVGGFHPKLRYGVLRMGSVDKDTGTVSPAASERVW